MSKKPPKRRLLLVNYSMNETNTIFSHQFEVVLRLSPSYSQIIVLSNELPESRLPRNVLVFRTGWIAGSTIISALRFMRISWFTVIKYRPDVIFCHMTEVQNLIVAPIARLMKIPNFLWYAHANLSTYLRWSYFLSTGVITSTRYSCPINGNRIFEIGQGIDSEKFRGETAKRPIRKLIHIGRFDESKNILTIIETVARVRNHFPNLELEIVGTPSNSQNMLIAKKIMKEFEKTEWVHFSPSIPRSKVPEKIKESDCFIHAYEGSLDKVLIEATMMCRPVVTNNLGYRSEFGSWNKLSSSSLQEELRALLLTPEREYENEVNRRHEKAIRDHDISKWIIKLNTILIR